MSVEFAGDTGNDLLFLVGMPRSGTTILLQTLAAHPAIDATGETFFFETAAAKPSAYSDISTMCAEFRAATASWKTENSRFLLEKTPRHLEYLPLIRRAFPSARVIAIIRDPRAVIASLRQVPWDRHSIAFNATRWNWYADLLQDYLSDRDVLIRYESLVAAPETFVRDILNWIGLETTGMTALGATGQTPAFDPELEPWKRHATDSISADNLGKWKSVLTPDEAARIEALCRDGMIRYGYVPTKGKAQPGLIDLLMSSLYSATHRRRARRILKLARTQ